MIDHCCDEMTRQAGWRCREHPDVFACPDALVRFEPRFREYGLIVHDGGSASREIAFCPWCGARLPRSQRDRWFDALDALGIDPGQDEVPPEFEDDRWLREGLAAPASAGEAPPRSG
ncbi:hypothetical protein OG440_06995 [Streptomyces sp. NBC_00637]|uniref:DUF6980 family protein n=1 Tax=Streptomyces sp. NBC_00637 TaxID=2903667 RepID=UPI003252CD42